LVKLTTLGGLVKLVTERSKGEEEEAKAITGLLVRLDEADDNSDDDDDDDEGNVEGEGDDGEDKEEEFG
jgi:hypothetical protein